MAYNPKSFSEYLSEETKEITFVFGRFNPPTNGHEKVFDALKKQAGSGQFRVYASQSNDPKKNPLKFKDKIKFLRKMFPKYARNIMADSNIRTVFDIVTRLYDQGFTKVNMVVGEDRLNEFDKLLNKYNGEKGRHGFYQFEGGIKVISAGARDPDSDDVTGMSASKLRAAASANDFTAFSKGMPTSYKGGKELFNAIRKGMGLKESHNHRKHIQLETVSEEREDYINGNLFKEGDTVVVKESSDVGTITMTGSNYVLVEFSDGKKKRCWLDAVEVLEEDKKKEMPKSKYTKQYHDKFDEDAADVKTALQNKSEKSGIAYSILKKVYERGEAAWQKSHRPGTNPQQWGLARVNSFIMKGKTWDTTDSDLAKKVRGESTVKESLDENLRKQIAQMASKFPEGSKVKMKHGGIGTVLSVTKDSVKVGVGNKTMNHKPSELVAIAKKEHYEYGSDEYTQHVKGMTPDELDEMGMLSSMGLNKIDRYIDRVIKKPIYKKAVRFYLDQRKKSSGSTDNAKKIMMKTANITGLDYKNLNQVFHDMINKGLLPKHLAFEDNSKSFKDYLKNSTDD